MMKDIESFVSTVRASGRLTLLALDLGAKKVGVAKAHLELKMALPYLVVKYKNQQELAQKLQHLIVENQVGGLVVGLPKIELAEKFAAYLLQMELGVPFIFEDESYTTAIANELMADVGLSRKKRNEIDDKISAQLILESFLKKIIMI